MLVARKSSRFAFARPLLALAVIASLAACGSDNNSTGPANIVGAYSLTSVDGSTLPYTVPNSDGVIITFATAVLNSDKSYTVVAAGSQNGTPNDSLVSDAGTYAQSGSNVTFTSTKFGASYSGTASNNAITVTVPGALTGSTNASFSLVFTKGT